MRLTRLVLTAVIAAFVAHITPVQAQQGACAPPAGPPSEVLRVTVGHFGESASAIGEFCRLLATQNVAAAFVSLGSVNDPRAADNVKAALEGGKIDVLWINSLALGRLLSGSTAAAKVIGVSDFLVIHVVTRDVRLGEIVGPASFAPNEVMVAPGRSGFFADYLFGALGLPIRCLDPTRSCQTAATQGAFETFLEERPARAVVIAAPTFRREGRDDDALISLQVSPQFRLVSIPAATVVRMRPIDGMLAATTIPQGYYGLGPRPNVPPNDVPTAASVEMLATGSPPDVEARVRLLFARINRVLLNRLRPAALRQSLVMIGQLAANSPGRLLLHEEFANTLVSRGLLPPGFPSAALPTPPVQPPQPPPQPPPPVTVLAPKPLRPGSFDQGRPPSLYPCRQVVLVWSQVVGAASYEVNLGQLFQPTPSAGQWSSIPISPTSNTNVDVSRWLRPGSSSLYRWSVRARGSSREVSAPSPFLYFTCAPTLQ